MKPCPVCGSNEIYQYKDYFLNPGLAGGATLLPGLGGFSFGSRDLPVQCVRVVGTFEFSPLKKPGRR